MMLFKNKSILINALVFVILATIFLNNVNQILLKSVFLEVEKTNTIVPKSQSDGKMYTYTSENPKIIFSKKLASEVNYTNYLNRKCEITGSFEDRKKVRWVFQKVFYETYDFLESLNKTLPYYFHIIFFSILLFLTYYINFKIFPINYKYKYLFLFYIAFIFQHNLSEYQFSIIEMFFLTTALYASRSKNFLLFLSSVILATLNRESGILISMTWLIFNSDIRKVIYTGMITSSIFLAANFDIISCIINPNYFVPSEYQQGQFNFRDIGKKISYVSTLKLLLINYIIPFGFCFYIYFNTKEKNTIVLLLVIIYLIMFLVATPANHIAVRLMLLPTVIALLHFQTKQLVSN